MKYDVTVIGAGVIGCLISRELSRYELKICLIDRESDVCMGASKANSGIIHAGYATKPGTLKALFNVRGNEMMGRTATELGVPFKRIGSLVLAFSEDDMSTLKELLRCGNESHVPDLTILSQSEMAQLEPALSKEVVGALFAPTAGIICPYELTIAAAENAVTNGVELKLEREVTAITPKDGDFLITAGEEEIETHYIINAAGVFADAVSAMAGDEDYRITPRRGEYMLMDKSQGQLVNRVVFQPPTRLGKGVLVTPTVDGNLLIGPTALDQENKYDVSTTAAGLAETAKGALKSVPGIALREVINSFAGIRAVPKGGDFTIAPSKHVKNLIHVCGIESPGLSASPAIAEYTVSLLQKEGLTLQPKTDFNHIRRPIERFAEMSDEEKLLKIRDNPAYGHVVCRCEKVTEGEIVEAIHRPAGARNLDAIKRRTRQGMGRCQGGFCTPRVVSILARELGVSDEEITKSGGASIMLAGKLK
jgi:glycerol-3-phosphate dehydrogenase